MQRKLSHILVDLLPVNVSADPLNVKRGMETREGERFKDNCSMCVFLKMCSVYIYKYTYQ